MGFDGGDGYGNDRTGALAVRLLRAGQSFDLLKDARETKDYIDNRDGTVTHTPTGLIWKRCIEGQVWTGSNCNGDGSFYTWDQAQALTNSFAGHNDWRVPTVDELISLIDYTDYTDYPSINRTWFSNTNTVSPSFWSASANANYADAAWAVDFFRGNVSGGYGKGDQQPLRLVRAGQSFGFFHLRISKIGEGIGAVISNQSGIHCGNDCGEDYVSGAAITLTAVPNNGYTFSGWSGDCKGVSNTCTVQMTATKNVTANFMVATYYQTIGTINFNPSTLTPGSSASVSAIATSALPVRFSSITPTICTVNENTVTGIARGLCMVAADQIGNMDYNGRILPLGEEHNHIFYDYFRQTDNLQVNLFMPKFW